MTPDERAEEARRNHAAMYKKPPERRRGPTPEAKVKNAVDAYLKTLGVINIRTNAGSWQDGTGRWIYGAKAGTSDRVVCLPNGVFCAIEDKSERGRQTEAQQRFQARVESCGALYILARSRADVRAALVARFGESVVKGWEGR